MLRASGLVSRVSCRLPQEERAMTSDVEDILAAARSLPPQEQLEVLHGLAESLASAYPPLEAAAGY
jgi:hypothetical protein